MARAATVRWATRDITAKEGEDFTGKGGTISFLRGESSKTLSLPIIDDAVDEGEETFRVMLYGFKGLHFRSENDSEAIGTISNDDSMPRAWLSRFGRTVGSQAVEVVSSRMGARSENNTIVVGGAEISSRAKSNPDETLEERILRERLKRGALGWHDGEGEQPREMTMEEVWLGSSFHWRSQREGPGRDGWAVWGQALTGSFEGAEEDVTVQGEVNSGFLGADLTNGSWKAGFAVSQSRGKGTFDMVDEGASESSGEVESNMTAFYPYAGYEWGESKTLWAMLGMGQGDMTLVQHAGEERTTDTTRQTDISMGMAGVGAKSPLLSRDEGGVADIVVVADGLYVRMKSDASEGMEPARADVTRLRLMIDSSRSFEIGDGGTLTPSIRMGVRHDGGDAENGVGVEAGGTLSYQRGGLTIEGSVRTLLAHQESGYEEWGASARLRLDPGETGRGLSLSVSPTWGEPASGTERLWSAQGPHQLGSGNFEAATRLEAEIGYGLGSPVATLPGNVTPYLGLSLGDDRRAWRTGTRWQIAPNAELGLELSRTRGGSNEDEVQAITIQGSVQW